MSEQRYQKAQQQGDSFDYIIVNQLLLQIYVAQNLCHRVTL